MSWSESHHAAEQLPYRVFTATRPGLTDIPAGYELLAWVAKTATHSIEPLSACAC
jgi:hypothetical protein